MKPHKPIPLVLCEGKEDRLVMEMLAQHAGLGGKLAFQDYGGESKLRAYLANLKVSPEFVRGEFSRILVTRDADKDFDQAWASLKGSIQAVFSSEPMTPGVWISTENGSQVSAWVIPGRDKTGMIETLCLEAARTKSPSDFGCLDPFIACLENLHGETPHEKVRFAIRTIIAQGTGAKKRLSLERAIDHLPLDWDDEAFTPLRELLTELSA
jgi:hypothetical protein